MCAGIKSIHTSTAFGLTPHCEACQIKNRVNIDSITEVLDPFKAEQNRTGANIGSVDVARVQELENRLVELTNQRLYNV